MVREFAAAAGTSRSAAYEVFCHEYNREAIQVPEWGRKNVAKVCRASLDNWEAALEKNGLAALAGKQGRHRKGTGVIDATPGMADVVIAHILEFYNVAAEEVLDALQVSHQGQALPSLRVLQRWMRKYRDANPKMLALIDQAFRRDENGNLSTKAVLELRTMQFDDDENWQKAMKIISDSLRVVSTKDYVRVHEKTEDGKDRHISLNISGL